MVQSPVWFSRDLSFSVRSLRGLQVEADPAEDRLETPWARGAAKGASETPREIHSLKFSFLAFSGSSVLQTRENKEMKLPDGWLKAAFPPWGF